MRQKTRRTTLLVLTAAGAVAGFFLRRWQLATAFDSQGLMVSGSASVLVLGMLCALVVAAVGLLCRGLATCGTYVDCFSSAGGHLAVSAAGALLLLAGAAIQVLRGFPLGQDGLLIHPVLNATLVMGVLGLVAGLCMLLIAVWRQRGMVPPPWAHFLPCIYLVVRLIIEFKRWSVDPAILDYCFLLFAAVSSMCATYHLGGFCFEKGGRRISTFWCLLAVLFTGICLADGGLTQRLLLGGMGLWLGSNAWQLLDD